MNNEVMYEVNSIIYPYGLKPEQVRGAKLIYQKVPVGAFVVQNTLGHIGFVCHATIEKYKKLAEIPCN